jgi:SAM-dependent methyltransferase
MAILQRFFQANKDLVQDLKQYLPQAAHQPFRDYENLVHDCLSKLDKPTILDIGGGKEWVLGSQRPAGCKVICLDLSIEQLRQNSCVDELILADADQELPLAPSSIDMVISRTLIEHLKSPEAFFAHLYRVLKPGGYGIHLFPCKFAPVALINLMCSKSFSQKVLFYFRPEAKGKGGFPAYYRHCYHNKIKKLLKLQGYEVTQLKHYHNQFVYFEFLFPLFLIYALYEMCTMPIKNLASFLLIVTQKPIR